MPSRRPRCGGKPSNGSRRGFVRRPRAIPLAPLPGRCANRPSSLALHSRKGTFQRSPIPLHHRTAYLLRRGRARIEPRRRSTRRSIPMRRLLMATAALSLLSSPAFAHCDSMDGPVVQDAQRAIAEANMAPILKWVTAEDEDEIRSAFEMTLAVRGESEAA